MGGAQVIPFRKLCGYVLLYDTKSGKGEGIQRGVENSMLWSEIGSGFEFKIGGTSLPRVPRSTGFSENRRHIL